MMTSCIKYNLMYHIHQFNYNKHEWCITTFPVLNQDFDQSNCSHINVHRTIRNNNAHYNLIKPKSNISGKKLNIRTSSPPILLNLFKSLIHSIPNI